MYQPFMPNFVKCFRKITEYKTANSVFFLVNLKCIYIFLVVGVRAVEYLGENQIDIHKLTCFVVDG